MTDAEDLADELMDTVERFSRDWSAATDTECAEALTYLAPRIAAMASVRSDETMNVPAEERDHEWLGASKHALRIANAARHQIVLRQTNIERRKRQELANADTMPAFEALKGLLRTELGRDGYAALWERVYQQNPMLRVGEIAGRAA